MSNKKSTKRALITSLMAVAVCVVMLIGTTFAWFTDTASTSVNSIKSGTLNIVLQAQKSDGTWYDLTEDTVLEFKKAAAGEGQTILWEPGCSYELPELRVVNNGNLALSYTIKITGIQGDAKLNEAIEWTINDKALDSKHDLAAGKTSETLTIEGHMKEDAGNEYQGLSIDGISITVYATQDTVEYDSYDNEYDEDAFDALEELYPVYVSAEVTNTGAELAADTVAMSIPKDAIADGATSVLVTVNKSADVNSNFTVSSDEDTTLQQFEVKVTGIKEGNSTDITLKMFIGKGYSFTDPNNLTVQHLKDDGTVENLTGAYDSTTGFVTFKTKSFSPFAIEIPKVDAVVGTGVETTYYESLESAVAAGGDEITILRDVTLNNPLEITRTVKLVGNNHTMTTASGTRVVNINSNTEPVTFTAQGLNVDGSKIERGITVGANSAVITIVLENCKISADHYALNIASNAVAPKVTVRNSTFEGIDGYCAFQTFTAGTVATFENCTLVGNNKWSGNDDDFATLVINTTANESELTFKNCRIEANEQGTANEYLLDVRVSDASVTFDGCKFFVNGAEVSGDAIQENMKGTSENIPIIK